jgi:hypothetical protein
MLNIASGSRAMIEHPNNDGAPGAERIEILLWPLVIAGQGKLQVAP